MPIITENLQLVYLRRFGFRLSTGLDFASEPEASGNERSRQFRPLPPIAYEFLARHRIVPLVPVGAE